MRVLNQTQGGRRLAWTLTGVAALLALGAAGGCGDDGGAVPADAAPIADAPTVCEAAGPLATTLTTDDGVALAADVYTTGTPGDPGVVLLHMIPPFNDKSNYPAAFIEPLVARGFHVVNVNRRGAPGSDGVAEEAFTGPNGKLDAKAAYDFILAHPCAPAPTDVAVVGASNGTTTAVDFSVFAAATPEVEQPFAMVFLSGGPYTENQNALAANQAALGARPILFAYPPDEAAWNDDAAALGVAGWSFTEYSPGAHGTGLFASNPESIDDVIDFIDGARP